VSSQPDLNVGWVSNLYINLVGGGSKLLTLLRFKSRNRSGEVSLTDLGGPAEKLIYYAKLIAFDRLHTILYP
jgi:hypothetical protein